MWAPLWTVPRHKHFPVMVRLTPVAPQLLGDLTWSRGRHWPLGISFLSQGFSGHRDSAASNASTTGSLSPVGSSCECGLEINVPDPEAPYQALGTTLGREWGLQDLELSLVRQRRG